jgi:iron complex transport system substrate-binding protein
VRVASLLPAGTEIVAGLGAEESLVGISHECDFPHSVTRRPRLTWSPIDGQSSSGEIDAQVRALRTSGKPVIVVDGPTLRTTRPDLILLQDLCEVCAVTDGDVRDLAQAIDPPPALLPLTARTLGGIFSDIRAIAAALGREPAGHALVTEMETRLAVLAGRRTTPVPVVVVEWLEPLYLAGHWVPELVQSAGGVDIGAEPGSHSVQTTWSRIAELEPQLVLVALCGFGVDRARTEWHRFIASGTPDARSADALPATVWALDGNAYTSRPGPRVIDGAERIADALAGREVEGLMRLR